MQSARTCVTSNTQRYIEFLPASSSGGNIRHIQILPTRNYLHHAMRRLSARATSARRRSPDTTTPPRLDFSRTRSPRVGQADACSAIFDYAAARRCRCRARAAFLDAAAARLLAFRSLREAGHVRACRRQRSRPRRQQSAAHIHAPRGAGLREATRANGAMMASLASLRPQRSAISRASPSAIGPTARVDAVAAIVSMPRGAHHHVGRRRFSISAARLPSADAAADHFQAGIFAMGFMPRAIARESHA